MAAANAITAARVIVPGRADLEQEIVPVERQLSATDRSLTPAAIGRFGDVILRTLRWDDAVVRQGYARRLIDKVVLAPDISRPADRSSRSSSPPAAIPSIKHQRCLRLLGSGAPQGTKMGTQIIGEFRFRGHEAEVAVLLQA